MQDMHQLEEVHDGMKINQIHAQMGKDAEVTKAKGAAYTGQSMFARQYEALMSNKEILRQQTQTLSQMPTVTVEKILAIQKSINDEIDSLLRQEQAKSLEIDQINQTEIRNFNHVHQKHRQAKQNAKGNNTSAKETRDFYFNN